LLTNFVTVRKSLDRLKELEMVAGDVRQERLTKKELARLEKERLKLEKNLLGIKGMKSVPDAVFVIDTRKEAIAVQEARKLKIPVIGIVDTNCDPDEVDHVIPGNDDALRAIRLFAGRVADAILAGRGLREARGDVAALDKGATPEDDGKRRAPARPGPPRLPWSPPEADSARQAPGAPGPGFSFDEDDMNISAEMVRKLREETGAGMMDCKSALVEASGD